MFCFKKEKDMNQISENLLNLSLSVSREELEKSPELNAGYFEESDSFELIVKFNGDILQYEQSGIRIDVLLNGYAICLVEREYIDYFLAREEIEYAEKSKQFYYV